MERIGPPAPCAALRVEQPLNAPDRIALTAEQRIDTTHQRNIVGPIIASPARTLQRAQLRKSCFPISQDMLRASDFLRKLADRPEGLGALFRTGCHIIPR